MSEAVKFTKDDLKAAKERCEKATVGPWKIKPGLHKGYDVWREGYPHLVATCLTTPKRKANADFIAHARTDLPSALDALEEAWKELGEWRELVLHGAEWPDGEFDVRYERLRLKAMAIAIATNEGQCD